MDDAIESIRCDAGSRALLRWIYHEENGLLGREQLERPALGGGEQERAADADLIDNVDTLEEGRVWVEVLTAICNIIEPLRPTVVTDISEIEIL